MKALTMVPAYGRDYKSKADAELALITGKDFQIMDISCKWDGSYCNLADLKTAGYTHARVRYNNLRDVALIEVEQD